MVLEILHLYLQNGFYSQDHDPPTFQLWERRGISCDTAGHKGTFQQGEQVASCALERGCMETLA